MQGEVAYSILYIFLWWIMIHTLDCRVPTDTLIASGCVRHANFSLEEMFVTCIIRRNLLWMKKHLITCFSCWSRSLFYFIFLSINQASLRDLCVCVCVVWQQHFHGILAYNLFLLNLRCILLYMAICSKLFCNHALPSANNLWKSERWLISLN